jgi:hypothetical protein
VECGEGFAGRAKRGFIARASSTSGTACTFGKIEQDAGGGTPELTGEISVTSSDASRDRPKPDQHAACAFINGQGRWGSGFVHALAYRPVRYEVAVCPLSHGPKLIGIAPMTTRPKRRARTPNAVASSRLLWPLSPEPRAPSAERRAPSAERGSGRI